MVERYYNPFQAIEVLIPKDHHPDFERYCQKSGRGSEKESPFPRMIDFWFLALCIAVHEGLDPRDIANVETTKIIEGTIFSSDPWRVDALQLLAIGQTQSAEVVANPRDVMKLANGLAAAGIPRVLELLQENNLEPLDNLLDGIEGLIREKNSPPN